MDVRLACSSVPLWSEKRSHSYGLSDKIAELSPGDVLRVVCTDPGALNDIPAWCRINGHTVLHTGEHGDAVSVTIEVGDS